MKVVTGQGTVLDIDNGAGSVPTTGTAAASIAGFPVGTGPCKKDTVMCSPFLTLFRKEESELYYSLFLLF